MLLRKQLNFSVRLNLVNIRNEFDLQKRGQVAIFIIVAIIIIAVVSLFFAFRISPGISGSAEFNPETYLDQCIRQEARKKIDSAIEQGGFVNPQNYKTFNDIKATYLCENINYYKPCINQHPALLSEIEREIEREISSGAAECLNSFREEAERRNFAVSGEIESVKVMLNPETAEILMTGNIVVSGSGSSQVFEEIKTTLPTPLGELGYVASEIVRQEAQFCHFSAEGYSLLYRDFDVRKNVMSDSTEIYTIEHKNTGKKMHIAIRGCAIPAGF